ncbi:nucleoside triphosphate pyrophosphohydrolase [Clostridium gasigenes]|uniref:nucleoside triphosphate pyrophosphohydrolase n=1 Tax=Clostridium gasigenes TaxID=94869 RepID=UPI0016241A0F|nr:nucleoside triphosphate pyrophosphohydrolase [Clostridium gasigenes]MBB6625481.1 nucleoside triphosphate pyrophosphohydrolase [Clostridium gasigenes]MBU3105781.1 nucleoside triphosphate pyrophosphohydrolase [Clostridium gasigenes]MBU3109324.1 nucleoside triphosphate pyrophosphohydrolase [Clostridium gasigenes]
MIKIVGLGPGAPEALTIGAVKALEKSENIFFRTEKHPTVDYLKEKIKTFKTYDHFYEEGSNFDEVYENIAKDIICQYKEKGELIYAVPGHPLVAEKSVFNLMKLCDENNIEYKILPAVSFIDAMIDSLKIDPIEGIKVIDAFDMKNQILDKRIGTIITQVYNPLIASEVKLQLLEFYNDDTIIDYVRAAGIEGQESIRKIPIYELDMQEDIDYLTSVYVPKDLKNKRDFNDLVSIIDTLRGEDGCPWDREQTHESLKNQLIEECYEVIDAINNEDIDGIIEELGDVLLHVVFNASIGNDDGYFNITDVIESICTKMIYRHPHVFKDKKETTSEEVITTWDELKTKEKKFNSVTEELKAIAKSLPALIRADKVQKKAAKVGFDWDNVEEAALKVEEELKEVLEVYKSDNQEKIIEEVGDLIFSCVNVSRFLKVNEEEALSKTTEKFIKRFSFIEEFALSKGKKLTEMNLEQMNNLWDEAKKIEKTQK